MKDREGLGMTGRKFGAQLVDTSDFPAVYRYNNLVGMVAEMPSDTVTEFKAFILGAAELNGEDMAIVNEIVEDIDQHHAEAKADGSVAFAAARRLDAQIG